MFFFSSWINIRVTSSTNKITFNFFNFKNIKLLENFQNFFANLLINSLNFWKVSMLVTKGCFGIKHALSTISNSFISKVNFEHSHCTYFIEIPRNSPSSFLKLAAIKLKAIKIFPFSFDETAIFPLYICEYLIKLKECCNCFWRSFSRSNFRFSNSIAIIS